MFYSWDLQWNCWSPNTYLAKHFRKFFAFVIFLNMVPCWYVNVIMFFFLLLMITTYSWIIVAASSCFLIALDLSLNSVFSCRSLYTFSTFFQFFFFFFFFTIVFNNKLQIFYLLSFKKVNKYIARKNILQF